MELLEERAAPTSFGAPAASAGASLPAELFVAAGSARPPAGNEPRGRLPGAAAAAHPGASVDAFVVSPRGPAYDAGSGSGAARHATAGGRPAQPPVPVDATSLALLQNLFARPDLFGDPLADGTPVPAHHAPAAADAELPPRVVGGAGGSVPVPDRPAARSEPPSGAAGVMPQHAPPLEDLSALAFGGLPAGTARAARGTHGTFSRQRPLGPSVPPAGGGSGSASPPINPLVGPVPTCTATASSTGGTGSATQVAIANPGNQCSAEGNTVSLQIQASGGTGSLSYGATGLPPGLTINGATGLISGTITYAAAEIQGGHYSVTVTAYDSTGASSSTSFSWTVTNTDTPPTLNNPGNLTSRQGDAVALQLSASDPDGDPLTYSATGLPGGLTLNATTGLISGVLAAPDGSHSPYTVTVSASDGTNTASQAFTWTVTTVQIDPVVDQNNLIGDSVSLPVVAWGTSGQALTYSATGLPPGLSINSSTGLISGTVASTASVTTPYSVTVTATDGVDPASTSFAWTIGNFALSNPGNQTNAEGDAVALQLGVQTNGHPALTFSATGLPGGLGINPGTGLIAGTIANLDSNSSPYSVTVSATDGVTTSSQTFSWTVTHILITDPGPQVNKPGDVVSLPIQANDPDMDPLTYTAAGLPSGLSMNSTTGVISGTIASTAGSATPYSVTVTASDGPHSASDTFSWTVSNGKVSVTNPGTQNSAELANVSLQISASDPDGDPLSYSATGLPPGLTIGYGSGLISGTVDGSASQTNGGVYHVTVLASDGSGDTGSATFTWNISHTNQAPTLDNPGDQVDHTGDVVSLPLFGYDADGDTVTYSATGLPGGLSINSTTGLISGTLPASAASSTPYSVTVTASDGTLTASQTFKWFVTKSTVTLTNPGSQTNTEGNTVSLQLSASDSANLALTYRASGLPAGLSLNATTGLISGTVAAGDHAHSPYAVTVTATDTQGNSSGQQFVWTINVASPKPVVINPGSQINKQGDVVSLQVQASDPNGNTLSYSATGLPPGLSMNSTTGLISGLLSSTSATGSPYSVTVTASNGTNSGSATFTWSVTNQAVTVTNPGTQNSSGGATVSLQISATDPAHLSLTYAATGLPPGLSINASTGLISGTLASTDGGAYAATVMASDSQGNSGSAAFTWNVTYLNQAPTIQNPGDQLNKPGDAVSLQLSASDVDDDTLTYSATGLPAGLSINSTTGLISGTLPASAASSTPYSVTVKASDGTLSASQAFKWFVTKGTVTLTNPGNQTNTEGNAVSLQLAASDSAHLALTYGASGLPGGLSLNTTTGLISGTVATGDATNSPYAVTVTATDTQGNSSAQQFAWTINPPSNALSLTNPGAQTNAEGDSVSLQLQASDPDGDTLEYSASGLPVGLFLNSQTGLIQGTVSYSAAEVSGGKYNVTVTANDGNGNTASQSFVWTITDTARGPWLAYPGLQNNMVNAQVSLQLVAGSPDGKTLTYSATGLPAGLTVNASTGLISGTITAAPNSYTVTATVTDTSNQTASQTFTWQVSSSSAPQVILAINGTVDHSDDVLGVGAAQATPVVVTLQNASPGPHTVQINIPSGRSQLDEPTLQLYNGGSATINLTALQTSAAEDDVQLVALADGAQAGDGKETNEDITFPDPIQNADTPAGMPPRIPKSNTTVATPVTVTLSVPLVKSGETVTVKPNYYGPPAGWGKATGSIAFALGLWPLGLQSADSVDLTQTQKIWLLGVTQTAPGSAGLIGLVAGTPLFGAKFNAFKSSSQFSVASIPITVKAEQPQLAEGKRIPTGPNRYLWGAIYKMTVVSDSGNLADLDQVKMSEVMVHEKNPTGIYKNDKEPGIAWWPPTKAPSDANGRHLDAPPGTPMATLVQVLQNRIDTAGNGHMIAEQHFIFSDARTGVPANADGKGAMIVKYSGFEIKQLAEKDDGKYFIKVTRTAKANNGAEAGDNASSAEQVAKVE
jgi:hypothetical protein